MSDKPDLQQSLFRYLERDEVERILGRCPVRHVRKGEMVLQAGQRGDRMYLLESGQVEVLDDRVKDSIVLAEIGAGSFFGEIALIDGLQRTKDVRALTDCRIRELRREEMESLYDDEPEVYAKVSRALNEVLSSRLRATLDDEYPLIQYIRKIQGPAPRAAAPGPAAEAADREALGQLYRAIQRAKRHLFAAAEGAPESGTGPLLERFGDAAAQELDALLRVLQETLESAPGPERFGQVKRLFFQEMYPCLMRSRTVDQAYLKPRGYSLDHAIQGRILEDRPEGDDALGILVDRWALDRAFLAALRRRVADATAFLEARVDGAADRQVRLLSLGCGSGREVLDLLAAADGRNVEITCIDADHAALEYLGAQAGHLGFRGRLRLLQTDVVAFLRQPGALRGSESHAVYALSLLDRLEDEDAEELVRRAWEGLLPGGEMYLAATSPDDPSRTFCEVVLEWFLRRRSATDLGALAAGSPFPEKCCRVIADPDGVNLVLRAQRPE